MKCQEARKAGKNATGDNERSAAGESRYRYALAAAILGVLVIILYLPLLSHPFHDLWDDDAYITANQRVLKGLTPGNIAWAFSNISLGFYYPLTWVSHMADVQFYGLDPAGHYFTGILIHAFNSVMLFFLLGGITNKTGPRFAIAGLFAVHPMNVESVAWLAERKNILAASFLLLAIWSYSRGVEGRKPFVILTHVFFAAGLMAKSSIVMFPFLLMILDLWPLKRISADDKLFSRETVVKLLKNKAWFFLYSAIAGMLTVMAQHQLRSALLSLETIPFRYRVCQALMGFSFYLRKLFLPLDLCTFYPHQQTSFEPAAVAFSLALMAGLTFLFWTRRRREPALLAGWTFFCVALFPVIGLLQVGGQAYADRYVYFPYWGLFVLLVLGIPWNRTADNKKFLKPLLAGACLAAILSLAFVSRRQIDTWKDQESLWKRASEVSLGSAFAYFQLGRIYDREDRPVEKPLPYYEKVLEITSPHQEAVDTIRRYFLRLGNNYETDEGRPDKALAVYEKALALKPGDHEALNNIAGCHLKLGDPEKAIKYSDLAIEADPRRSPPRYNKACALAALGRDDEALEEVRLAAGSMSGSEGERARLADLMAVIGRKYGAGNDVGKAGGLFLEAVKLDPGNARAWCDLGYVYKTQGKMQDAENALRKSFELDSGLDMPLLQLALIELQKGKPASAEVYLKKLEAMKSPLAGQLRPLLARSR